MNMNIMLCFSIMYIMYIYYIVHAYMYCRIQSPNLPNTYSRVGFYIYKHEPQTIYVYLNKTSKLLKALPPRGFSPAIKAGTISGSISDN